MSRGWGWACDEALLRVKAASPQAGTACKVPLPTSASHSQHPSERSKWLEQKVFCNRLTEEETMSWTHIITSDTFLTML